MDDDLQMELMPWLHVKRNYFEIILQIFRHFISHLTRSETEIKLFRKLKEFWNHFRII